MFHRYSITLSSFISLEDVATTMEKLYNIGFREIEMFGEPDRIDINYFKNLFQSFNFKVIGITGMWGKISPDGWKRKLLSNDIAFVKYAERYIHKCLEMCNQLGGGKINICLFSDQINSFDVTHRNLFDDIKQSQLKKSFPILKRLIKLSNDYNIDLLLEPLNRYSTPFCTTVDDALMVIKNCEGLRLMLDTFHMNIEEDSFEKSIWNSKEFLSHLHFADNNRKMPGYGHIDFKSILKSLSSISYSKSISFEPTISKLNYVDELISSLQYLKEIEMEHVKT